MNSNYYTKMFLETVKDESDFYEVLNILKKITLGNIWLIGGFVYRNIARGLYGTSKPSVDLDFIVEKVNQNLTFPLGWTNAHNRYGNPKFIRTDGLAVDFVPLNNISSILRRKVEPTIYNFLTGTPLTIQSIAYDVKNNRVIGSIGIKALQSKTISINDAEQAKIYANKKERAIEEIIQEKAKELGFYINNS
ncbi:MAG: hypothetical protein HYW79_02155 [Parcubacteria group bacterium]|nr:hypothetical protein [Parcubacteria group bacterium]